MHELSRSRRIGILLICSMSLLIVGLDVTIVNVALPSIGHDLGASVSGLQWVIDAYTLVLASLLMLSGSTADRLGRKRTFILGLAVFSTGSLLCSLAPNLELLVVFRMMQAIGGSMLNPVAMSIITNTFTDPRERAQAVGVWGAVVGVSMALGPVIGGLLVTTAGWQSIFWINIPVGVAAIVLTLRYIPESKAPRAPEVRSCRTGADDRALRLADVRDHRGADTRLVLAADRLRVLPRRGRRRSPASCTSSRAGRSRWSTCGSSGRSRSPPRR